MLGNVLPRDLKIEQTPLVYANRDNLTTLTITRLSGRRHLPVDLSAVTRWLLVLPALEAAFDSDAVPAVFSAAANVLTLDLSGYAVPTSVQPCYLIAYDAEHTAGQVLVDNDDCVVQIGFRSVPTSGSLPLPDVEYLTDAPQDGEPYGRQDGAWVPLSALVSGVSSVNGQSGVVTLTAASVGADAAGTAATAVAGHLAQPDPHSQYALDTDLSNHVASSTPHAVLTGVDRLAFDQAAAVAVAEGELAWNATDKTLDLGLPDGVVLQLGQELHVRGLNTSGDTMFNGRAVFISGASGNRLVFSAARADQATADKTIAVLTQDILNNQQGLATGIGLVRGIDTSGFAEGAELWLSASVYGGLTPTKPPAPNNAVRVGYVVRSHASLGSIFVRVQTLSTLAELHDVTVTAPADGDVLVYDTATQTWVNETASGGGAVTSVDGQTGAVDLSAVYAPAAHVGSTGAAHGNATTGVAGFMSAADKSKLDGVATGATANSSDATLLARANHTGEQAISTVTGLQAALDGKASTAQATQSIIIACSDETTVLTAGTGKVAFRMPYAFTLSAVRASLGTAQTSGSILTVDINEAGVSILSTKLTVDNGEKTSTTAATAAVISDTALADDAEITIDLDQVGDGTAKGLKVTLIGVPA